MVKVFVIIVTYNAMKWIDRCLGSLYESVIPCTPVIIDNLSRDETVGYIRKHYPDVHIIENQNNRGFGQANNQGIEWAYKEGGTHFFLLNQDAWVQRDTIGRLVEIQDKYSIALVSPIHLNGLGNSMDYNFFTKIVLNEHNISYVTDTELRCPKDYYIVHKINAAAWMLSRKTIEEIGGFDPIYFHYGEDGNYCQRLKYHDKKVAFVPGAYIHHDRNLQGNMRVYKKQEVVMHLLYYYSDINSGLFKNVKKKTVLHFWLLKRALHALLLFKFKNLWNIISGYFIFFSKIPQIPSSKKQNKRKGASWLNML